MPGAIRSYRDLKVWQMAMDAAVRCYEVTKAFPREEAFGLTSQIRRAAASIPANIAEGHGRGSRKEYRLFLRTAQASLRELETHLILSTRVALLDRGTSVPLLNLLEEMGRMLQGLQRALRSTERGSQESSQPKEPRSRP